MPKIVDAAEDRWDGINYDLEYNVIWAEGDPSIAKNANFVFGYMRYWRGKTPPMDVNGREYVWATDSAIAGAVGNFVWESRINPALPSRSDWLVNPMVGAAIYQINPWMGDQRGGVGWYYNAEGNYNDSIGGYANTRGGRYSDIGDGGTFSRLEPQLDYLLQGMGSWTAASNWRDVADSYWNMEGTPEECARSFYDMFEKSGGGWDDGRAVYASAALYEWWDGEDHKLVEKQSRKHSIVPILRGADLL